MQNARNRPAGQPEEEQHRLGLARGGGFKPSARDGLRVRLLGQTDAASPVWRLDAEPRPNGPFMWQSSGLQDVIFSFFVLSVEFGNGTLDRQKKPNALTSTRILFTFSERSVPFWASNDGHSDGKLQ
jgi:hypothetical protein